MTQNTPSETDWFVYVLTSAAVAKTYVGISTDVSRRLEQHNGELPRGARSTRSGRPWQLGVVCGPMASRGAALQLEHRIKASSGIDRLQVARQFEVDRLSPGSDGRLP